MTRDDLGDRMKRNYENRTRAYDGFGTVALKVGDTNGKGWIVGILPEHLQWQRDRYHSGFCGCVKCDCSADVPEDVLEQTEAAAR